MEILIQQEKNKEDQTIGTTRELCRPKEQRDLSGGTLCKKIVVIFISLITSHFEHPFRLLPKLSGDCNYTNPHLESFPVDVFLELQ